MKWPATLTIIRHGESAYNDLKVKKNSLKGYQEFKELFDKEFAQAKDLNWASSQLKSLATTLWHQTQLSCSDYQTPLTEAGKKQAFETGKRLSKVISLPDVIYVSPYVRTRDTLQHIIKGWPALKKVKVFSEERIREQEHGIQSLFNDKRIHYAIDPMQGLLSKLEGEYHYRHVNGESKADVRDRVRSFLATLIREHAEQNVLLVSHHLTLLCIRATLERWSSEQFVEVDEKEKPFNCGLTIYKGDPKKGKEGKLTLSLYNKKLY